MIRPAPHYVSIGGERPAVIDTAATDLQAGREQLGVTPGAAPRLSPYLQWLRAQGELLLPGAGIYWRPYHGALVPARPFPVFPAVPASEGQALLRASGCPLMRFSTAPTPDPTPWWYVVGDRYDLGALSHDMRKRIRRARRQGMVRPVSAEWLAENGYACYLAAYERYRGARPRSEAAFRLDLLSQAAGPFECWGAFSDGSLVGYLVCIVDGEQVHLSVGKFSPEGLRQYASYALHDAVLSYYIGERGMTVNNGNRAISHDTQIQDYLLRFGMRRLYARLCVIYRPWLAALIRACFPARNAFRMLSGSTAIDRARSLLYQEELRRRCECV